MEVKLIALPALLLLACARTPTVIARSELSLPPGDAQAGKAAFVSLRCTSCHIVSGHSDLPPPFAQNPGPELGGNKNSRPTEAELITSIVNPSKRIAKLDLKHFATKDGYSRMGHYAEVMSVQQLIDLIAFIQEAIHHRGGP